MSKCVRTIVYILTALAATVAAALTLAFSTATAAHAEDAAVPLTPIPTESKTEYAYLESPHSVFADASGVLVACESTVEEFPAGDFSRRISHAYTADKAARVGANFILLEDGTLFFNSDPASAFTARSGKITDFDIYDGKIYAVTTDAELIVIPLAESGFDASGAVTYSVAFRDGGDAAPTHVTVCADQIVMSVVSRLLPGTRAEICTALLDDTASIAYLETLIPQTDSVVSLASIHSLSALYILTEFDLQRYTLSDGGYSDSYSVPNTDGKKLTALAAFDGTEKCLYALNSLTSLVKLPADISDAETLAASASYIEGFFNSPYGACVKHSTLYVADTANNRIAEFGSELSYADKTFAAPVSVASDSKSTLYVAHNYNTIAMLRADGSYSEKKITGSGSIRQIAVNSEKTLYILARNGLWQFSDGSDAVKLTDTRYKAISLSAGHETLYALRDGAIDKLTVEKTEGENGALAATVAETRAFDGAAISFAVDLENNIFLMTNTGISRIAPDGTRADFAVTLDGAAYGFSAGQIVLDAVKNNYIRPANGKDDTDIYTNAVIVDTAKHRVFVADGAALGIKLVDGTFVPPSVDSDGTPVNKDYETDVSKRIIRKALEDTPVFNIPVEMQEKYVIAKGRDVIVPVDQPENTPKEFYLILVDNLDPISPKLVQGYVYRDALSDPPLPYEPPADTSKVATVYSPMTPVYKYPSLYSPRVTGFSSVDSGAELKVLDFVRTEGHSTYRDERNNLWHRVLIGGVYEGYILSANVSFMDFEPVFIHPAYNAEVIEYDGINFAQAYTLSDDGKYVPLSISFPVGTQLEVVGSFDTSVPYTQVKYLEPELGTLTCYVQTVHIKYNGVNIVLIVAIVVIIITVIIGVWMIARVLYVKKKRLVAPSVEDENNKPNK